MYKNPISILIFCGKIYSLCQNNSVSINGFYYYDEDIKRLLKLYYKLSYNLLPIYVNRYREIIEQHIRQNIIHPLFLRMAYAECTPLLQLIKLLNHLKADVNDKNFK